MHGHEHHRDGQDPDAHRQDRRRLWAALVVTSLICVAEVIGARVSNSVALLSDAWHMLSDVLGEVLALFALFLAARPAGPRRTFGYYRMEILMALLQGAILFVLASWVIWEAAHRLAAPPAVHTGPMLAVAAVGLLANGVCAALLAGGRSLNVRGAYLHVLLDGLSSVAVLLCGIAIGLSRRLVVLDPLLSIAIGVFVYYSAYRLTAEAVEVLLEAVPRDLDPEQITAGLLRLPGIVRIHDLHIWTIKSGMPALSVHLVVEGDRVSGNDALLTSVKGFLAQHFKITHSTLQIESASCGDREWVC